MSGDQMRENPAMLVMFNFFSLQNVAKACLTVFY